MAVSLELIDVHQGLPVQVWPVASSGRPLQIGRSEDSDVVISSPFVSRAHAYLQEMASGWELVSLSDKGIFIDGEKRVHLPLEDGVEFRLANKGPLFRFRCTEHKEPNTSATICFDEHTMPRLVLDRRQLDDEVTSITDNSYFEGLQRAAAEIQQRKRDRGRRNQT
jgi:pSer/pThr/pTyr-binding forkhead associated (FHA) protein